MLEQSCRSHTPRFQWLETLHARLQAQEGSQLAMNTQAPEPTESESATFVHIAASAHQRALPVSDHNVTPMMPSLSE